MSPLLRRGLLGTLFGVCWWAPYAAPFRPAHATLAVGAGRGGSAATGEAPPVELGWYLALGLSTAWLFALIVVFSRELPELERRWSRRPLLLWLSTAAAGLLFWVVDRALWPDVCVFCAQLNTPSPRVKVEHALLLVTGTALFVPPLCVGLARVFGRSLQPSKVPLSLWLVGVAGFLVVTPPYLVLVKAGQFTLLALGAVALWLREVPRFEPRATSAKWRFRALVVGVGLPPFLLALPLVDRLFLERGARALPLLDAYGALFALVAGLAFVVICLSAADALAWALRGARSVRTRLLVFGLCSAALAFTLGGVRVPVRVMGEGAALAEVVSLLTKAIGTAAIVSAFAVVLSRELAQALDLRARSEALARALETLHEKEVELVRSERMASIAVLVRGIAHELNNPITYISGNIAPLRRYADFLTRVALGLSDGRAREDGELRALTELAPGKDLAFVADDLERLTADIGEGARRAALIIGDLQNLTSVSRRGVELVDLARAVRQTVALLSPRTPDGVAIETALGEVPPLPARAGELEQMLLNLTDNAVRAVGPRGKVTIGLRSIDGQAELRVKDDGAGMTDEVKRQAFEPFFTTRAAGEGSGLGLAIVATIVRAHQGVVSVESEPGLGTEFTVRLPLAADGK